MAINTDGETAEHWSHDNQMEKYRSFVGNALTNKLRQTAPAPSAPATKKVSGGQTARGSKRRRAAARGKFKSNAAERMKARRKS